MKKILVTLALGFQLLAISHVKAQDPAFSQFYASPLLLNPAILGASDDWRTSLCYRNQWGSVNSGYTDYDFNTSYPIYLKDEGSKIFVGLALLDDKAGAYGLMNGYLSVGYNKELGDNQNVCLALYGGLGQLAINTSGLTFDDQYVNGSYNANTPTGEMGLSRSVMYPDAGFGFTWYMNPPREKSKFNAYAGISGFHLNEPNQTLNGGVATLPIRMNYIAGIKIFESEKVELSPNVMVCTQGGNVIAAVGAYCYYNLKDDFKLTLGMWYRANDAIPILIGVEYKGFELGYSYDMVTSTLNAYATGLNASEITLAYNFARKKKDDSAPMIGSNTANNTGSQTTTTPGTFPFPEL
ncbi:MAG: PorP/SprF family type IX secretion system membrane protein [Bacteroidia bacterium]|nr:PorP/SprF family type IX secretion system membrane protein [Bacteroidia bacterium]